MAIYPVLCRSLSSQLERYPERHWDSKYVSMMPNNILWNKNKNNKILGNRDSACVPSVKREQ